MTEAAFDRLLALVQAQGECGDGEALAEVRAALATLEAARDAAQAANEAKTRFLASVSHEIRSPLNAIYGYAQLLDRSGGKDAVRAARVILRSSEHLSHLIEGLLDIAQVESGSLKLSRDTINFPAMLGQLIDMLALQASAKGLALVLDAPPGLPVFVRADQKRLRQVLINLLSNAVKFTQQGTVTLRVRYRSELATFEVIDTGMGIAAEEIERIFVPFERGAGAAQDEVGVGLGLAITRALVQIMGGDIRVESTPGEGSRFIVQLMLSQPLAPPPLVGGTSPVSGYLGRRRQLLLIDDDPAHLAMLAALLEPLGFAVDTASEGADGLAKAARVQPDLVLLDVSMPGQSGWEIAAKLRQRLGPMVRIVILSGEVDRPATLSPDGPADNVFVMKPFVFDMLLDVIAAQLGLTWLPQPGTDHPASADRGAAAALPVSLPDRVAFIARAHLTEIERLVKVGHVRAIEAQIDALASLDPDALPLADRMRGYLDAFDLRALSNFAKAAQHDER